MKKYIFLLVLTSLSMFATAQTSTGGGGNCTISGTPNDAVAHPEFQNPILANGICPRIYDQTNNIWYKYNATKPIGQKYVIEDSDGEVTTVTTIAKMSALEDMKSQKTVFVIDSLTGGRFIFVTAAGNTIDNYLVFPSSVSGYVLKRQTFNSDINATWIGINETNTNNSPLLNDLIAKVSLSGGGKILFPSGSYNFTDSILLQKNVEISGETRFSLASNNPIYTPTYFNFTPTNSNIPFFATTGTMPATGYIDNIVIKNLTIRPNATAYTAVAFRYPSNSKIENIKVTRNGVAAFKYGIVATGTIATELNNVYLSNCDSAGLYIQKKDLTSTTLSITNWSYLSTNKYGVYVDAGAINSIVFDKTIFESNTNNAYYSGVGNSPIFTNCYFEDNPNSSITGKYSVIEVGTPITGAITVDRGDFKMSNCFVIGRQNLTISPSSSKVFNFNEVNSVYINNITASRQDTLISTTNLSNYVVLDNITTVGITYRGSIDTLRTKIYNSTFQSVDYNTHFLPKIANNNEQNSVLKGDGKWTALTSLQTVGDFVGIGVALPSVQLDVLGDIKGKRLITNPVIGITDNTGIGANVFANATSANGSVYVGANAGLNLISGSYNTSVGRTSLFNVTTGSNNTAFGGDAGRNATGNASNNTFLGTFADVGSNTNLTNATAVGANAIVNASNSMVLGDRVNVGINTSTPQYKVDIDAQAGSAGNPLRLKGLNAGATTDSILSVENSVVRRLSIAQLINSSYATAIASTTMTATSAKITETTGTITLTLPAAATATGKEFTFVKNDAVTTLTISAAGAETINGVSNQTLVSQWSRLTAYSTGTKWIVIGQ